MSESQEGGGEARSAGRGFLLITGAKLWFMLGGALITFGLPHLFGGGELGRAAYGQYVDLNNSLSILSMVLITGGVQTVSRWAAHSDPAVAGGATRRLLVVVGGLATLLGAGFAAAAGYFATRACITGAVNTPLGPLLRHEVALNGARH